MSKKDRLKAQSEKQLRQKRELELEEKTEKQNTGESKAAAKMRKKAKKFDTAATLVIKLLMILPFGWSAFYYGGIFIVGISTGIMEGIPKRIAAFLGAGTVLCLAGLLIAFFSKYILQFVLVALGTVSFMYGAQYIIGETQKKLAENYVTDAALKKLDKTYMTYFYPLLAMTLLSAVLLIMWTVKKLRKKRREKIERDNAPVKSIVE